jgi:BolA protein
MTREEKLLDRLRTGLAAEHVALEDESARHAGHEGAQGGAGHYRVLVVSARFAGLDPSPATARCTRRWAT